MSFNTKEKYYYFEGINEDGEKIAKTTHALSKPHLKQRLNEQHIYLIKIKRQRFYSKALYRSIEPGHIEYILYQLSQALQTHVNLVFALDLILGREKSPAIRALIQEIKISIEFGNSLSKALNPKLFNTTIISFIKAGEASGQLNESLKALCHYIKTKNRLKKQLKKALTYPCTVFVVAILITLGLFVFIVPQFETIYQNLGGEMPYATQMLIKSSAMLLPILGYGGLGVGMLSLIIYLLAQKKPAITYYLHRLLLGCPIVKTLILKTQLIQWSQLCAFLLKAGLSLPQTLDDINPCVSHLVLQQQLQKSLQMILAGSSLSRALEHCQIIQPADLQLITLGENTGQLDSLLSQISNYHREKLEQSIERFCQLLEPLVMVILAGLIGTVMIVMYLPIFNLGAMI